MSINHRHIVNQIRHPELKSDNTLHVIGVISNPVRYHSRYRLYREWLAAMEKIPNVKVYTVEAALGDRHHELTETGNSHHLQLNVHSNLWIKENMINLAVRYLLPKDWKYVCWCDCDVFFKDPNWAQETLHQLQHFQVVQPWSDCLDLGPNGQVLQHFKSFGYYIQGNVRIQRHSKESYPYGHSGYAWACTRAFWEQTQGLMDFCILGSADAHMAWAMVGETQSSIHQKMSMGYHVACYDWQRNAMRACHKQVGCTLGIIEHAFHGSKAKRFYKERWSILIDAQYDPLTDLTHDPKGMIQLIGKKELEYEIHKYNLSRHEDSIDP